METESNEECGGWFKVIPIIPTNAQGYIYNNLSQSFTAFRSVFRAINPPYVALSPTLLHSAF